MSHPAEAQLALYAGGDLGFLARISTRLHVRRCATCQSTVTAYSAAREKFRTDCSEMPEGVDWDRLSSEMTGNIRVGLAAGECVAETRRRVRVPAMGFWKPALAACAVMTLVVSGMWLNFPERQRVTLAEGLSKIWKPELRAPAAVAAANPVYLESTRVGIQFTENGSSMTMMHPDSAPSVVLVSTQGSVRARYVDSDTGQVTITNVYAQ